ncbi:MULTISPECIES: hypothetical protein [unclassified Sphingopyxis]|uniref:hypothetical protein n=1 Tax=unclassified Sphingopyxis TaxID=2614943 RepID=UPI0007370702|nr:MULTISPECIES: hypothetical protein [unclassified Sphingopyxis]KTE86125.1 hypothetical protein ATE72_00820 [Sphingopyxis sp. HXXIV]
MGLIIAIIAAAGAPSAFAAAEPSVSPVCQRASHERLLVREGRDVCGASLNRAGQPMAMGYLPTTCPRESDSYRIDAAGRADRCVRRPAAQGERS